MQKLHTATLLILDNFNVLPKDEPFLKELMKNDMQLLITSRCKLKNYDSIEIKELDKEKELTELFYKHCPSAKRDPDSVSAIIEEVNCHTLTGCSYLRSQRHGTGRIVTGAAFLRYRAEHGRNRGIQG